jgi:hypothetical protein
MAYEAMFATRRAQPRAPEEPGPERAGRAFQAPSPTSVHWAAPGASRSGVSRGHRGGGVGRAAPRQ